IYGIQAPEEPRDDLFNIFLKGIKGLNKPMGNNRPSEMLRLNTSIPPTNNPNRLGVLAGDTAGFPNGRRLTDDVVDIALQAMEGPVRPGQLVQGPADGVAQTALPFRKHFPYVAVAHSGSDTGATAAASSGTEASSFKAAPDRHDAGALSADMQSDDNTSG